VTLPSLRLSALALAVAQAVASGADGLEAAVLLSAGGLAAADVRIVRELGGSGVPVLLVDLAGTLRDQVDT
jgi:hypothetical protein